MKKTFISIAFCIIFVCLGSFSALAQDGSNASNYTLIEMDEDEKKEYISRFNLTTLSTSTDIYKDKFLYAFDVSSKEKCALFFDNAAVVIMDSEGKVEKVLKFSDEIISSTRSPSSVCVRWKGENLELIGVYDKICVFTPEGEIIEFYNYETQYGAFQRSPAKISVNGNTYELKYSNALLHFWFGNRYDLVIKTTTAGTERILFDCERALPKIKGFDLLFAIVFNTAMLFLILKIVKSKKQTKG